MHGRGDRWRSEGVRKPPARIASCLLPLRRRRFPQTRHGGQMEFCEEEMIGTILITLVLGLPLSFLLNRQCKRIRARGGQTRWLALSSAALAGGALGIVLNRCEFSVGHHMRVTGIPNPGVFFHLEDGQWVDFVVPFPYVNLFINICLFCLCGAAAVALILERGDKS